MKVKTNTKEKFHVISVESENLSANMAAELASQFSSFLNTDIRNIVLKLSGVKAIEDEAAELLVNVQQKFYENNASFVLCELTEQVEEFLDQTDLLELMNVTPTESEAWDIVQMEEIERELLGNDEE